MNRDFNFVDAKYRQVADGRYADNPFIAAIPALPSDRDLMRELAVLPKFDPLEREWSDSERIQRLDVLHSLVVPLPRHINLARSIWKMLITGYGPRKPFSVKQNAITKAIYEHQQAAGNFASLHDAPLASQYSMALIGASGCGKSFMLRQIAGMLPKVIYHPDLGKWQIPYLFVEMSYDGESMHTLASSIYQELDQLLPGGNYVELFMERKGQNATQRLMKALSIAYELGVGFIIVDEAQNKDLTDGASKARRTRNAMTESAPPKNRKDSTLIKLLIQASNISHIPLLLTGTLELKQLLTSHFSRARRMSGRGSAEWKQLECSGSMKAPGEFELFLLALFKYQWIRQPIALDDEWVKLFFDHTQGIPDIIIKLWEACQECAIATKAETISHEMVQEVFAAGFVTTAYGIKALRTQDKLLLEVVTDLFDIEWLDRDQVPPASNQRSSGVNTREAAKAIADSPAKATKPTKPSPTPKELDAESIVNADLRNCDATRTAEMQGDEWKDELHQ